MSQKDTILTKVNHWEYYDPKNWHFAGDVISSMGGNVNITSDSNGVYGFIDYGTRFFEILSTNLGNISILSEHFPQKMACGTKKNERELQEGISGSRSIQNCDMSKIRVLVLYTNNALASVSNDLSLITSRVNNGRDLFNTANLISGVNEAKADIEIAAILPTNYVESLYIGEPITQSQISNYISTIRDVTKSAKITYKADIVLLLGNYPTWSSDGIAKMVRAAIDDDGYAMVQINKTNASYIIAHEIGHLLGGDHDDSNQNPSWNNKAHIFDMKPCPSCPVIGQKYTIMTTKSNSIGNAANRWSNPLVLDNGVATGTTSRNVGTMIKAHAPVVAGFRESANSENALMSGPLNVYSMGTYSYSMSAGCPEPNSYTWYISNNGTTWTSVGTGAGISQFFYPGFPSPFYVKCELAYPNIATKTFFRTTNIYNNGPYRIKKNESSTAVNLSVLPNPSSDFIEIDAKNLNSENAKIRCYDEYGNEIKLHYEVISNFNGNLYLKSSITHLKKGIYKVHISDDLNSQTVQFIKL